LAYNLGKEYYAEYEQNDVSTETFLD
jgi:hypothetical protein